MDSHTIGSSPPVRYFVRDDDVGELTPELRFFVNAFLDRQIPVSYQIIPARLTQACADFLLQVEVDHPDLIEFGQHGLHHAMTVKGKNLKREFGPERDLLDQTAAIAEGLAVLKSKMGLDHPFEVFTPPQHKYDRSTPKAAAAAGHKVFSAASYPSLLHQVAYGLGRALGFSSVLHHGISHHGGRRPEAAIRDLSIAVDVDDGRGVRWPADRLGEGLAKAIQRSDVVGLMFHHAVYERQEGQAQLSAIADVLAGLGSGHFSKIMSIAEPLFV